MFVCPAVVLLCGEREAGIGGRPVWAGPGQTVCRAYRCRGSLGPTHGVAALQQWGNWWASLCFSASEAHHRAHVLFSAKMFQSSVRTEGVSLFSNTLALSTFPSTLFMHIFNLCLTDHRHKMCVQSSKETNLEMHEAFDLNVHWSLTSTGETKNSSREKRQIWIWNIETAG